MKLTRRKATSCENLIERMWSHAAEIRRFIRHRLPRSIQAVTSEDDVLQDTFRVAFRDVSRYQQRGNATLLTWLKSIATNRLLDAIKHHQRQKRGGQFQQINRINTHAAEANIIDAVAHDSTTPISQLLRKELIQLVRGEMANLPRSYRQALSLQFIEKLSYTEIGERMGRTPTAVQGLIKRGKERLRMRLNRFEEYAGLQPA